MGLEEGERGGCRDPVFKSAFEAAVLKASGGLDLSAASVSQFSLRDSKTETGTKELLQNMVLLNFRAEML